MRNKLIGNWKLKIENCRKGFTLIELLIVIAIIGVLATLLMVNFIGVRQRARDAQRKSDLRQIQSALEIYRSDQDSYPPSITCGNSLTGGSPVTTYMNKIPCDPSGINSGNYYYYSNGAGTKYELGACLENTGDPQAITDTTSIADVGSSTLNTCNSNPKSYFVVLNP